VVPAGVETRLKVKALGALFAAGATLVMITIVLPHARGMNELGLIVVCVNAYIIAATLFRFAGLLPGRLLPVSLAWGTTLITAVAHFSGEHPSPLVFFYLWIFLYSGYFFTRRETVAEIAYVGVNYAALLALNPPPTAAEAWWIVGMGAMFVAAGLIVTMRAAVEELIVRLHEAARTDPLTQLQNRRGFREALDLELERGRRGGTAMSLVVGDLDGFKLLNDRRGRGAGDTALQRVARVLSDDHRRIDATARVGGGEFALVLPDADTEGAQRLAERLRSLVAQEFAGDSVPLTISFGVATFPDSAQTAGALLRASDEALHAAKQQGRDRVVVHTGELAGRGGGSVSREIEGESFLGTVLDLAEAVDIRFSGSARHCETVGRYAELMARELGLSKERVARVRLAGVLHDIGKIGVPDAILGKAGSLDDDEWVVMKGHAALGAQILEHPSLVDIQVWVGAHHERVDGRGYPNGLAGDDLPLEARILAVADAYEAMTSDRSYRASLGAAPARDELRRCGGSQFDSVVVEAFVSALDAVANGDRGAGKRPSSGRSRVLAGR
jgi:diguanylate cyclase (GGDEF)-like protein/putative nucleotidyltransferase with HDIG domain